VYEVRIYQCPERQISKKRLGSYYKSSYQGMVYCAEVPGGLVYVRRHGSVGHWSGNSKTGVSLRLPVGVKKVGNEAKIRLHNIKSGKLEFVSPGEFSQSAVVLPDQVKWKDDKPIPRGKTVRMSVSGNEIRDGKFEDAHYVMPHSWQIFNLTSNLIPFLNNTAGGRASMASRHIEQAISLVHREAPLIQVDTGMKSTPTFEDLLGGQASHAAPVSGRIVEVSKNHVVIQTASGEKRPVSIYNNYPLNDAKAVLHSTPLVAVGDTVKAGQTIADTNFSKGGKLAIGVNLRTAYLPFKGYNFEDGVVISESAQKKLSSEHLHKNTLHTDENIVLSKRKFQIEQPGTFKKEQYEKLDDNGVIRVGQRVQPGDPLIAAMKPYNLKDRSGLSAIRKSMSGAHDDKSLRWDSEFEGEVVGIHKNKDGLSVHVRTVEPMQIGDKLAGRYGNKGIVTMILPDAEMPHYVDPISKKQTHIEVALNPSGVPGRINVGQLLETAAGKIAMKTGKPYVVKNFETGSALERVQADLKKHGLTDTEELIDPVTKLPLGKVAVGYQHHMKLAHQVEKKLSVRSGMQLLNSPSEGYDLNLQPAGGGGTGGMSMGVLGMYALLAHGAKANIREMQTYKSEGRDPQTNAAKKWPSQHDTVWAAIQTGNSPPTPKPTFAFAKFTDMLRASGVNIEKKGHTFALSPMTDDHIRTLAKKALPNPADLLESKEDKNGNLKPKVGGLFDEHLTGGHGGRQWTRIELAEPVPNPMFEGPIKHLLGLNKNEYLDIVHGKTFVTPAGHITETGAGVTGGAGIKVLLDRIDVKKELPKAQAELDSAKGAKIDKALKKVKYLRALEHLGTKPSDAYVLHNLPVLPPIMRPVSMMQDGKPKFADINHTYSYFAKVNDKLKDPVLMRHLVDEEKKGLREDYYDGVQAIMGLGKNYEDAPHKGIMHEIAGKSPKTGFFQDVLMNRRQDMTLRSTIVPEPALGLDQVGLPKHAALDLYRPFVVNKLKAMGAIQSEPQGAEYIEKKNPMVWRALEKAMEEHPILLKRDPVLHKHGVQAFKPTLVEGNAVKIHPLVTGGYNADFDGDTMSAFVPITREAVTEAHKMYPSNNLFNDALGKVAYQPSLESALGVYKLSRVGKDSGKKFSAPLPVLDSLKKGDVHYTDVVHLNGRPTTAGRVLLAASMPEPMQQNILHNMDYRLDKKGLDKMLTILAKEHPQKFGESVNYLKDLGNGTSYGIITVPRPAGAGHSLSFHTVDGVGVAADDQKSKMSIPVGAHTLTLKDVEPDTHVRDAVLSVAKKQVSDIHATHHTQAEKDRQSLLVYSKAEEKMKELHEHDQKKNPNNLYMMCSAGVKPSWDQYKQMVLAPMVYSDSRGQQIPTPVTRSYSEGLDVAATGRRCTVLVLAR
jgi:biotin carboxyl carrier protein